MKWIKCIERSPKSGQKIIIRKIHNYGRKDFPSFVTTIDDELAFWFMTCPLCKTFEWKPYTERKRGYDERKIN